MDLPLRVSFPDCWNEQIFSARAAQGGLLRRSVARVDREIGRDRFFSEMRARGFHLLAAGNQFVVICESRPVQILF